MQSLINKWSVMSRRVGQANSDQSYVKSQPATHVCLIRVSKESVTRLISTNPKWNRTRDSRALDWYRLTFRNKDPQFLEGLEEFFRGNSRTTSECRVFSILKTLFGCLCASRNCSEFVYWSWRSEWIVQPYRSWCHLQPLLEELWLLWRTNNLFRENQDESW